MGEKTLIEVMKKFLKLLDTTGKSISKKTMLGSILSQKDGVGRANSRDLFKGFTRWTLIANDYEDVSWPPKWWEMTVEKLASKLLDSEG